MPRLRPIREPERTADDKAAQVNEGIRRQRRILWDRLNEYVRQQGGWAVSVPGAKRMRVEVPEGSGLPEKLTEAGYTVDRCGVGMRLTGLAATPGSNGWLAVEIIEIELPR